MTGAHNGFGMDVAEADLLPSDTSISRVVTSATCSPSDGIGASLFSVAVGIEGSIV